MNKAIIPFTFEVDEKRAQAFALLPEEQKQKAMALLRVTLGSLVAPRWKTVAEASDHLSRTAAANGMTRPDMESILHEHS